MTEIIALKPVYAGQCARGPLAGHRLEMTESIFVVEQERMILHYLDGRPVAPIKDPKRKGEYRWDPSNFWIWQGWTNV